MTSMRKGANLPVPTTALHAVVSWRTDAPTPDVDVSALLLDGSGKVRSDADFVFYNQPEHASGAVRHEGKRSQPGETTDAVLLDLPRVEAAVERIIVCASADGGTFGQVPGLLLRIFSQGIGSQGGGLVAEFDILDAGTETAFLFGEFYRRGGEWKFRAVGQGYASGLAGLATDFGISVDGDEGGSSGSGGNAGWNDQGGSPASAVPQQAAPLPPRAPAVPQAPPLPQTGFIPRSTVIPFPDPHAAPPRRDPSLPQSREVPFPGE